ncbi:MAG: hypothetical protein R6X11_07280 [Desulfonatronovibrio sp.]
MNNKLPAWGEILLHYCASQKCKNGFSSQRPLRLKRLLERARDMNRGLAAGYGQ